MARRILDVTIEADGRDKGKVYRITELPASQAEEWAMRAFLAMTQAGIDVPDSTAAQGVAGLASMGFENLGKIPWEQAKPLMDEMMTCVQSVQSAGVRRLIEDDIEEVSTRLKLRLEVLKLHTDFFSSAAPSTSTGAA